MPNLLKRFGWILLCGAAFGQGVTISPKTTILPKTTIFPGAAGGGGGTFSIVQHNFTTVGEETTCNGSATCTHAVTSTGAGNAWILIAVTEDSGHSATYSSATGGTFTSCGTCDGTSNDGFGVVTNNVAYLVSSSSGVTSVSMTLSTTQQFWTLEFIEIHWTGSSIAFDVGGTTARAACTSCTGQALTLTGSTDVIVQAASGNRSGPTGISGGAGYTAFADFDSNYGSSGVAGAINTSTGTAPTWSGTSPAGIIQASAIALKGL